MSEEIVDDTEFVQQDFTTASEWEILNARLEEQFHEWKLATIATTAPPLGADQLSLCEWHVATESITYGELALTLTRYCCRIPAEEAPAEESSADETATAKNNDEHKSIVHAFDDLMSTQNNFWLTDYTADSEVHPLARWYGLRDFVVVAPVHFNKALFKVEHIHALISSIHIAAAESHCKVPVFVHGLNGGHVYSGVCESGPFRLSYDIVHLRKAHRAEYKYLSGLLGMFQDKVRVRYVDPVRVSVRLTYSLKTFPTNAAAMAEDLDFEDVDEDPVKMLFKLSPFRASIDPLTELLLFCGWQEVNSNSVVDNLHASDLTPDAAPEWSIRARFDDRAICHMSECIREYFKMNENSRTLSDLLGNGFNMLGDEAERNPFELLTDSKISSVLPGFGGAKAPSTANKKPTTSPPSLDGPLQEAQLMQMLYYMFPDAQTQSEHQYDIPETDPVDRNRIKSAHPDSLIHRMGALLALCNTYYGGVQAVAQLWAEFTQEMRFRMERCIQIPG